MGEDDVARALWLADVGAAVLLDAAVEPAALRSAPVLGVGLPVAGLAGAGVVVGAARDEPASARSPTVVPDECEPVTSAETGFCPTSSIPVTIAIAATNTAATPAASRTYGRRARAAGRRGSSAAGSASGTRGIDRVTGASPRSGGRRARCVLTSRSRAFVRRSDSLYSAALTVVITLASAAPITVPATPKNEAITADVAAARALPTICSGLNPGLRAGGSSDGSTGWVWRAADMSSVWSGSGLNFRGYDGGPAQGSSARAGALLTSGETAM